MRRVAAAESAKTPGRSELAMTVARNLHKLMAYKDEYEVARLYSEPQFRERLEAQFEGLDRIELLLAPPLLARRDGKSGKIRKMTFGPWIFPVLERLARLKRLRGTAWDVFGYTAERRTERALIGEYEGIIERLIAGLDAQTHAGAVAIADIPAKIRGFGHVKVPTVAAARAEWSKLMAEWGKGKIAAASAAE